MASTGQIMDVLGERYPWELAPEEDGSGLLVGSLDSTVSSVLCSVELSGAVVEYAARSGHQLVVSHHNHVFASTGRSPWDADTPAGALAHRAIKEGIGIIACHANADAAEGGTADLMAGRLRLEVSGPVLPSRGVFQARVVVFVPPGALEEVSDAMARAGAGNIGEYRHCSFRVNGMGTFIPGEGTNPYSGEKGSLNRENEVRLEMICPSFLVGRVTRAMAGAHPYEEVAFDVYRTVAPAPWGSGRMGVLRQETTCGAILEDLAGWSGSQRAFLYGDPDRSVSRVAVAPGDARSLVRPAYLAGCGLIVVGEVGWHQAVEALEAGMAVACLGNVESERALVPSVVEWLEKASERASWGLEIEGYVQRGGNWG